MHGYTNHLMCVMFQGQLSKSRYHYEMAQQLSPGNILVQENLQKLQTVERETVPLHQHRRSHSHHQDKLAHKSR